MHFSNTFGKSFEMRDVFTEKELLLPLFLVTSKSSRARVVVGTSPIFI